MEYYTSHERKPHEYLKTINLSKCEDMVAPLPMTNRLYVIKLSVRKDVKQCRDYFFDCSSEEEMISWVKCLAQVCGFSPSKELPVKLLVEMFKKHIIDDHCQSFG